MGYSLSIDEVNLSMGELYTVVTNKATKGKKSSIVAIIAGTKSEVVISHLQKIDLKKRNQVTEITLDMANSVKLIAKKSFPKAKQVTDRFHVQKLALEAVQEVRIRLKWDALDKENVSITEAKVNKTPFVSKEFSNGDTAKQLLTRSRFLLYKSPNKWSESQKERAAIVFEEYPEIKTVYFLSQKLRNIYNNNTDKSVAITKLAHWYNDVENLRIKSFNTIMNTIKINYDSILNYFDKRSTNASAESFNAKIKTFRNQFRGVRKVDFFLFRLTKLFA
ncbi:Transposase [Flavobacterium fryxellicola]|uniref:ISAon1 family transposase n=1 Tax=Flavobacterium fryxellicola TaxID=249352 RepID=UPI0009202979|nr:transposase [Flavobacterium fryxellicola]SHN80453.1 Transposase [Flavobacterium fryxellicola]